MDAAAVPRVGRWRCGSRCVPPLHGYPGGYLSQFVQGVTSAMFDTSVTLSFERLCGADEQRIGRAVTALADSGMSHSRTLGRVGLG